MRRELERIEIPGEHEARGRAWEVVQAAYAEREPSSSNKLLLVRWRLLVVAAAVGALVAASVTAPVRALLDEVREAIGVEQAAPALFDLPDGGRLLVQSDEGPWIVQPDGSKRLLGRYRQASWSPFGRFVVATGVGETGTRVLYALDPKGDVQWSLGRPAHIRYPRWGGTRTDSRIAYVSGDALRVVAGDGMGDRRLAGPVTPVAPAWRPGGRHELAYADPRGRVVLVAAESGRVLWRTRTGGAVSQLEWSSDGRRLLARRVRLVDVYSAAGQPATGVRVPGGRVTAAAFRPGGHGLAVAVRRQSRSELFATGGGEVLLSGPGVFNELAWSPDGRWLLVAWPDANQWVFVSVERKRRIKAVSRIPAQFESSRFPRVAGWCCPAR